MPWISLIVNDAFAKEVLALNIDYNVCVREELEHYRVEDVLQFLSWSVFFYRGW